MRNVELAVNYLINEEAKRNTLTHMQRLPEYAPEHKEEGYARIFYEHEKLRLICELSKQWHNVETGTRTMKVQRRYVTNVGNVTSPIMTLAGNCLSQTPHAIYEATVTKTTVAEVTVQGKAKNLKHCTMLAGPHANQLVCDGAARFLAWLTQREIRIHDARTQAPKVYNESYKRERFVRIVDRQGNVSYGYKAPKAKSVKLVNVRKTRFEHAQLEYNSRDETSMIMDSIYDGSNTKFNTLAAADVGQTRTRAVKHGKEFQPVTIVREQYTEAEAEMWSNAQYND